MAINFFNNIDMNGNAIVFSVGDSIQTDGSGAINVQSDKGVLLKVGSTAFAQFDLSNIRYTNSGGNYVNISPSSSGDPLFRISADDFTTGFSGTIAFSTAYTASRQWTFPDATGIVALTGDLTGYLPLAGGTMAGNIIMDGYSLSDVGNITSSSGNTEGWDNVQGRFLEADDTLRAPGLDIDADGNTIFSGGDLGGTFTIEQTDINIIGADGATVLQIDTPAASATTDIIFRTDGGIFTNSGTLVYDGPNTTADRTWTLPDATGTIALTSDLGNGIYAGSGNLSVDTVVSMHDTLSPGTEFNLRFDNILSETILSINPTINSVGIGTDTQLANLHVVGDTGDSVVFKVDGTFGELFTITDSLTGVLFSVNNISGLPVFEIEDTDEIRMGTYSAISGYTTARNEVITVGDTIIYTADVSNYTMIVFEYVLNDGTNLRAGNITAVTDGITVQSVETITTPSIGSTTDITMSVTLDASPAELNLVATTSITTGWVVKAIVRTI